MGFSRLIKHDFSVEQIAKLFKNDYVVFKNEVGMCLKRCETRVA